MVPETMAAGGIIAFSNGGSSKQKREDYKQFLEDQIKESLLAQKQNKAFEKTDAQIAEMTQGLQSRRDMAPWMALTQAGLGMMSGTSPHALTNIGAGGQRGLESYSKSLSDVEADRKAMLQQQVESEKAKLARQTGLTGQMQTSYGQILSKEIGAESAAATREAAAISKRGQDYLRANAIYKDLFNNAYDELTKTAKPGGINYKKYKENPDQQKIDARKIARGELSQDLADLLGFKEVNVTPPPAPAPKPGAKKGPVTVAVPGGKSYTFPTQEAADEFKRQANLK